MGEEIIRRKMALVFVIISMWMTLLKDTFVHCRSCWRSKAVLLFTTSALAWGILCLKWCKRWKKLRAGRLPTKSWTEDQATCQLLLQTPRKRMRILMDGAQSVASLKLWKVHG